jgi:PKD repeat protein
MEKKGIAAIIVIIVIVAVAAGGYYLLVGPKKELSVEASANPTTGKAPLEVNFIASATGGTGPYSYGWVFGDGGVSIQQNPTHTYANAGTYTATVTVTDNEGTTASDSVSIVVTEEELELSVEASANPITGKAPLQVNFTVVATGGTEPYSYLWDFGDGENSTVQNPTHAYENVGIYLAVVTVTDDEGVTASDSVTVEVTENVVNMTFTIHDELVVDLDDYDIAGVIDLSGTATVNSFQAYDVMVQLTGPAGTVTLIQDQDLDLTTISTYSLTIPAGTYTGVSVSTSGGAVDITWSDVSATVDGVTWSIPSGSYSGSIPAGTFSISFPSVTLTGSVTLDLGTGIPAPTSATLTALTDWELDNRGVVLTLNGNIIYP